MDLRTQLNPQHPVVGEGYRLLAGNETLTGSDSTARVSLLLSLDGEGWSTLYATYPEAVGWTVDMVCTDLGDMDGRERVFRRRTETVQPDVLSPRGRNPVMSESSTHFTKLLQALTISTIELEAAKAAKDLAVQTHSRKTEQRGMCLLEVVQHIPRSLIADRDGHPIPVNNVRDLTDEEFLWDWGTDRLGVLFLRVTHTGARGRVETSSVSAVANVDEYFMTFSADPGVLSILRRDAYRPEVLSLQPTSPTP